MAKKNGLSQKLQPSDALAEVIGSDKPLARTDVMKKVWVYIKANDLQDDKNRRNINCDGPMKSVFGKSKISMFDIAKGIGKHLS